MATTAVIDDRAAEWVDIDDFLPKPINREDITICLAKSRRKEGVRTAGASICFRGDAKNWLLERGATFGVLAKRSPELQLRLIPSVSGRRVSLQRGIARLILPALNIFPDASRKAVPVKAWDCAENYLEMTLPDGWTDDVKAKV